MTGALWAILSGVGFGIFQAINRRAILRMDVFMATFLQIFVSALVLMVATLLTVDRSIIAGLTRTAVINFSLAGILHFFFGWTFLNASQKHIGAARTGSVIGMLPIFGAVFAALTLSELPALFGTAGILLIVGGVYLVNERSLNRRPVVNAGIHGETAIGKTAVVEGKATGVWSLRFGLAAAMLWSLSPTFLRYGLAEVPDPLLGATIGMVASTIGFAAVLLFRWQRNMMGPVVLDAVKDKIFAAILVAIAIWLRWISLDLAPVAVVLALSLVSVPVVNLLSPLMSGHDLENVTAQVWSGSGLIIIGSLILIFTA
jgi:drug/metabolite transporter (DMT)-like permease